MINHPSHKLKHGDAYNYDTIVVGVMVLVNSFLGLPVSALETKTILD